MSDKTIPYFFWNDHGDRVCPVCDAVITIKTVKGNKEIQAHYTKEHSS